MWATAEFDAVALSVLAGAQEEARFRCCAIWQCAACELYFCVLAREW